MYLIGPGQCQMRVNPSELENVNGYKEIKYCQWFAEDDRQSIPSP